MLDATVEVANDGRVFITFTNFTAATYDNNIEMRVHSRNRSLALGVVRHFQGLVDRGMPDAPPAE